MTDLMEALFEYINKVTLQNYLAVDSDYRISSTRRDTWSLEILDHLDEEGRTLFDRYEKAAFQENSCPAGGHVPGHRGPVPGAERKADRLSVQPPPVIPPPSSWRRSFSRRSS